MPCGRGAPLFIAANDERARLVVDHLPVTVLADEHIRRDEMSAIELFLALHDREIAIEKSAIVMNHHARGSGIGEDGAPALDHRFAADEGGPAGMDAQHRRGSRPDRLHGPHAALIERTIEIEIGVEDRVYIGQGICHFRPRMSFARFCDSSTLVSAIQVGLSCERFAIALIVSRTFLQSPGRVNVSRCRHRLPGSA